MLEQLILDVNQFKEVGAHGRTSRRAIAALTKEFGKEDFFVIVDSLQEQASQSGDGTLSDVASFVLEEGHKRGYNFD